MKIGKTIWGVVVAVSVIVGLLTGIPMFFEMYVGIEPSGIFAWFTENSYWLLPLSCLVFGVWIGWKLRGRYDRIGTPIIVDPEIMDNVTRMFINESGEKKLMAAVIYGLPQHRAAVDDSTAMRLERLDNDCQTRVPFFIFDSRGSKLTYVALEDWVVKLFAMRPEIIGDFPADEVEKERGRLRDSDPR